MTSRRILLALGAGLACAMWAAAGEPLGLVLSGGGAKGAYEVGVWKALTERGLADDIVVISGTSVGALNAALFAVRPEAAESLWSEHMGSVFTPDKERIGQSIQKTVDDLSNAVEVAEKKGEGWKGVAAFLLSTGARIVAAVVEWTQLDAPLDGFIDSTRLAAAIDEALPREWPATAPDVYVTALEKGGHGVKATWRLNNELHERRSLMIRASAALPGGFDTVMIDGKTYEDGRQEDRGGDNVPLGPVLEHHPDVKTVIVVYLADGEHLNQERFKANRVAAEAAGVHLVEVVPTENIGGWFSGWQGTFDARPETARHLVSLGQEDARRVLDLGGEEVGTGGVAE